MSIHGYMYMYISEVNQYEISRSENFEIGTSPMVGVVKVVQIDHSIPMYVYMFVLECPRMCVIFMSYDVV